MKLHFFGATETVTGSQYLLEAKGKKILIDCGLYQGRDLSDRNWDPFPQRAHEIDAIILTHGHLDHCGLLPKLVREGFKGNIHATTATAEIARIVMLDSGHMHEEDAKFKTKRHMKEGRVPPRPVLPLYTVDDAEKVTPLFKGVGYGQTAQIADGVSAVFHDAGHILGSSMVTVTVEEGGEKRVILFSGDIGRKDKPILRDPATFEFADYVVMESTYGDRTHPEEDDVASVLADVINATIEKRGNIVIPAFAVERSQELLYHLSALQREKRIPKIMTFLDSPMAVSVTKVFQQHMEMYDEDAISMVHEGRSPFDMPGLKLVRTVDTSKSINFIKGSAIIIAGSGMCTGGRIKHHLVHNIQYPENTILFVGYQANGTLGRNILNGNSKEVRILGKMFSVRAGIRQIHGFSGHADRNEMTEWVTSLNTPPRKVFITHGEPSAQKAFRDHLAEKTGWDVVVPKWLETFDLE
ncbi:MAG: MBL fold metallo-hydrolase [Planctomycetes bacterium]|nr:MBL fold metallo-hydrolase [Planctomycetota bacterium]